MSWSARVTLGGQWGGALAPAPAAIPGPTSLAGLFEKALTLAAMGSWRPAMAALRQVTAEAPAHAAAWRETARLLRLAGEDRRARAALAKAAGAGAAWSPATDRRSAAEIQAVESALRRRMAELAKPPAQRQALHESLLADGTNVAAMRLLARLEWMGGDLFTARALLERAVVLAPGFEGARADFARLLQRLEEGARFAAEAERLLAQSPESLDYLALRAEALREIGDLEGALPLIERLVLARPLDAHSLCVRAQALHFAGRRDDSVASYRRALAIDPGSGEAWWGLAELRGDFLGEADIVALREHLNNGGGTPHNSRLLRHALGHALERAGDAAGAITAYSSAARLARRVAAETGDSYDPAAIEDKIRRRRLAFPVPAVVAPGWRPSPPESRSPTPIFIVGMPRAGSTLVEQILASHGAVEPTLELPVLANIVRDLALSRRIVTPDAYPECLSQMEAAELTALGDRYLEEAAAWRRLGRPFFIDKRPGNWLEVGLISRILPGARIVDVRRAPLAACFAMFKQMLAGDAAFSNDFVDLAHYYTQYAGMMTHWNAALPGRVHSLSYECLVEDSEAEIRRLLAYCDLPFEPACLRYWENARSVATPSAEQVRRPIFRDAAVGWRAFEPWLGDLRTALALAEADTDAEPPPAGYDKALTMAAAGYHQAAIEELQAVTKREPRHAGAWRTLGRLLRLAGRDLEADRAEATAHRAAAEGVRWRTAGDRRSAEQLAKVEREALAATAERDRPSRMKQLRERLFADPTDAAATHLLSRLEWDEGDELTALSLLERTLQLNPAHQAARANLVALLLNRGGFARALAETALLVSDDPGETSWLTLRADALGHMGDYQAALSIRESLVASRPEVGQFQCALGQTLHALGRATEAERAFRESLRLAPDLGQAWWGLADLKGDVLTSTDIATLRERLAQEGVDDTERMYMAYALGHGLERAGDHGASFAAYAEGARLFRAYFVGRGEAYAEAAYLDRLRGQQRVFAHPRLSSGAPADEDEGAPTPIFIVGMPRAGSTLVEQILASHPLVEGTRELPVITDIVRELDHSRRLVTPHAYPDRVTELDAKRLAALGRRYVEMASAYRRTDRPFFTDKRPWNWIEIGFIHMILPRARIIDVRREPMAACFAMFKQVLLDGADFSYDLHDLGRYYVEYAAMMDHWRAELPGRIHFLRYERLVEDTEGEVRCLLDYCGLPFDSACLEFWRAERAVSTPSAEQVRRPIFRDALEQWRRFEPWLGPLTTALGEPARA